MAQKRKTPKATVAPKTNVSAAAPGTSEALPAPISIPVPSNASEIPSVYANVFEMLSMNHIDVRLGFNEVVIETGGEVRTFRRANIVVSTAAFMTMVNLINANVQILAANVQQSAIQVQAHVQEMINAHLNPTQQEIPSTTESK